MTHGIVIFFVQITLGLGCGVTHICLIDELNFNLIIVRLGRGVTQLIVLLVKLFVVDMLIVVINYLLIVVLLTCGSISVSIW